MCAVKWNSQRTVPARSGWYITRNDAGELDWRAWGVGYFWKLDRKNRASCMNGRALTFDWQPGSWKTVRRARLELPAIPLTAKYGRASVPNLTSERRKRYLRAPPAPLPRLARSSPQLAAHIRVSRKRYVIMKSAIQHLVQNDPKNPIPFLAHGRDDLRRTGSD